ncbi:copine-3-like isoform X2 [Bolinopsis microptera]|uniref:copine-3-like isoform X2 n=1 Tax=Bolinopsis microptera TaxID=2820187 RepID=UPI00307A3824
MQQPPSYANAPPGGPPPPAAMVSKVDITISCERLRDLDVLSKSDPICVLYSLEGKKRRELGRTERLNDTLNPKFQREITIDYRFEEVQKLGFYVFDIDDNNNDVNKAEFLGKCDCNLGQIVSAGNFKRPLEHNGGNYGSISVQAQEQGGMQKTIKLTLHGVKLDKKDFFGKSDPYLEFHRQLLDGSYSLAHRTEFIKNTLNPNWKAMKINTRRLCDNNPDTVIKVECYDWDSDGSHDLIGQFFTTLAELEQTNPGKQFALVHPKKKEKRGYRHSGEIVVDKILIEREYTFLEYIQGGCLLNFVVGVDFTGSNGDPRDPSSLHYLGHATPNQYTQAITAVGNVIQDYDSDQLYPAFGFGARLPPAWQVSHQFSLNGNPADPNCHGIQGILGAYHQCINSVQLYGPTNASPIIGNVATMAREALHQRQAKDYFILLLLTDGILTDMQQTIHMIIEASELPLSIIIVGVGDADFSDMERLDADDKLLSLGNRKAKRDIVQFVPFRDFKNGGAGRLAAHVLKEVPSQLMDMYNDILKVPPMYQPFYGPPT